MMKKSIQEKLEAIWHRKLDLSNPDVEDHPCRPVIEVSAAAMARADKPASYFVQVRFADLSPDEARRLAHILLRMADTVDHIVAGVATNSAELTQQLRDSVAETEVT